MTGITIIDDFESGTLTGWSFSGNANWVITSNPVYEGSYAAKAGTITHNQVTGMYRSITVTETSKLRFYWKVSSEQGFDFLRAHINDVQISEISGEVDWALYEIVLAPGTHELKFEYTKDRSASEGSDTGYVDYITLEPYIPGPGEVWTQATASAEWSARQRHTAIVYDGKIWVMGGYDGSYKNDVWYSTDGVTWTLATASANWSVRNGHTSLVYDNKMWVMGGYDGSYKNDVWYSTDGITWIQATPTAGWSSRRGPTSVVHDGKMWVMGGYDGSYKNDVWYSTDGISWTQATAAAGWAAREGHTSVVYAGKMWVMGGFKRDVWYSTNGIDWIQATPTAGWNSRGGHTSVVHDGKMWVMGGWDDTYYRDVWYSTDGISWTRATASTPWSARCWHASVAYDNKLWVMGGYDLFGNNKNDVWQSISPLPPPVYVNSSTGNDLNAGDSCTDPVKTFGKAYSLIGTNGLIIVCNSGADFSGETVTLNKSFYITMEGTGYFYGPKAA